MKHDILNRLREHLNQRYKSKHTADKYYFAVKGILEPIQFDQVDEIDREWLEKKIAAVKTKNNFSAVKNGLKALNTIEPDFNIPDDDFFKSLSLKKKNRTKKTKTIIKDTNNRKINALKDEKYRYAYKLMQSSGLRVSEVAGIKKRDVSFGDDHTIEISITQAKGGKNQKIALVDEYLAEHLKAYVEKKSSDDNVFPAAQTLKNKASKLGIECHNQRRIAAMEYKKNMKQQGADEHQANEATKEFLRHDRFSTTKRYLYNRKLKIKDKKQQKLPSVYDDLQLDDQAIAKELDALSRLTAKQREYLNGLYKAEPNITNQVVSAIESSNGQILGLENRMKKPSSIYEKINERQEKKKIQRMNDILRYTGIYNGDDLADGTIAALDDFMNNGFKVKRVKNTWDNEYTPYKGINATLVDPSGQMIEVQFHTQESFNLKNGELHRLYEKYRILGDYDPEAVKLNKKMIELSQALKRPTGIERVKNK